MHAISENIEIATVDAKTDPKTKKLIEASFLKNGEKGRVLIKVNNFANLGSKTNMHVKIRFYAWIRPIYFKRLRKNHRLWLNNKNQARKKTARLTKTTSWYYRKCSRKNGRKNCLI